MENQQQTEQEILNILARGNETEIKHLLTDEVKSRFDYLIKDNLPKGNIDIQEAIQKEIDDHTVVAKEQEIIKHYSAVVREDISHRRDNNRRQERDFAQHLTVTQVKGVIKEQEFGIKKAFLNELNDFDKEAKNEIMSEMKSYTKAILNAKTDEEKEKIAENTYKHLSQTIEKHPTQEMKKQIKQNTQSLQEVAGMSPNDANNLANNVVNIVSTGGAIDAICKGNSSQPNPNQALWNESMEQKRKLSDQLSPEQFKALTPELRRPLLQAVLIRLMRDPDSIQDWANKKVVSEFITKHPEELKALTEGNNKEAQALRAFVKQNTRHLHAEGQDPDTFIRNFGKEVQQKANEANNVKKDDLNHGESTQQAILPKGNGENNLAKMDEKETRQIEGESLEQKGPEIQSKSMIAM